MTKKGDGQITIAGFDQCEKMVVENKSKIDLTLTGIVGFFLSVAPILDPYVMFEIGSGFTLKINDVIMLMIGCICFFQYFGVKHKTNYLGVLLCGLALITLVANINSITSLGNSLKCIFVWFVYALVLMYIWKSPCRTEFIRFLEVIATIASILVIMQFVAGYLGLPMWNGRIPYLELGKYDQWSGYIDKNTGDIRPNGIFQEASYVGIYLSVAYAQALKEGKAKKIILYAFAMLITTSMISIVSCLVITMYSLIAYKNMRLSKKIRRRIFFVVVITAIGLLAFVATNNSASESFSYVLDRISTLSSDISGTRMSSAKYRTLGHIDLFSRYTTMQKIFGVGVAQYAAYFNVTSYSNVLVTTILNSGILGLIVLISVLLMMLQRMRSENRVFFLILFMVLASDYQWFSWYFFYLITACLLENREDNFQQSNS